MQTPNKPLTLRGKQIRTPKSAPAYRTKSYNSNVDETLFGTPTRYSQQKETQRMSDGKDWDPPWATSPTKKGVPLLWTPFDYKDFNGSLGPDGGTTPSSKPTTPRSARSKTKYRLRSHAPTYVDETLFGEPKLEPSFKAPWNSNDNNNNNNRHLLWSPQTKTLPFTPLTEAAAMERPSCDPGEYNDPYIPPTPRDPPVNNRSTPVIKQRPGSAIKTPNKLRNSGSAKKVKQKLEFGNTDHEDSETKAIIERALRLAQATRDAAVEGRRNSDAVSPWRRPMSAREPHSPRVPKIRSPHISEYASDDDDLLSATGRRMPLSARSDRPSSGRPSSTRLRSHSAQRSMSGGAQRPSFRP